MEEKETILMEEITENPQTPETDQFPAEQVQPEPCVDDDIRTAEKKSTGQKRFMKWTGIVTAILVPILILVFVFTGTKAASSYEDAVEMVCEALEDGDQKQIEKLLFDREPMEDGELDSLFEDLEYYYGKGYKVVCEGIELVDKADTEDFQLLNRACEIMCVAQLEDELTVTGSTKLGELDDIQALYDKVMSFSSETEQYAFLARRYGGAYPVDISHFEDCEAYYVKAKIIVSDKKGDDKDTSTVYFTIICRNGDYMIDRVEGGGITTQYVGKGHLYAACDDALFSDNEFFLS